MTRGSTPLRLGTSTFVCEPWITPDQVRIIDNSPVVCVEVASHEMWDVSEQEVADGLQALRNSNLELWSVHSPFGRGLDLSSIDETVRERTLEAISRAFDLAQSLGCRAVVVHPSLEPIDPSERPMRLAQARRSLKRVAEFASRVSVSAALEPLPRSCLGNTADEFALLLQDLPEEWMGICLDMNHANLGQDLVTFIRRFGRRIITLHISDNDGVDEKHWLPGRGVIDWPGVVAALREAGYRGPWMYEVGIGEVELAEGLRELGENHRSLTRVSS